MRRRARRCRPPLRGPVDLSGSCRYPEHLLVSRGDAGDDGGYRLGGGNTDRGERRMTKLAPLITSFLRDYMPRQRGYSAQSCETYAFSFKLLFDFAEKRLGTRPSRLAIEDLDAPLIVAFLAHIEQERGNGASTRNLRLCALKTFMRYVEPCVASALGQI